MRRVKSRYVVGVGGALVAFGLLGPVGAGTKSFGSGGPVACSENGAITWSPDVLWPPNHKTQEVTFVYTDSDEGPKSLTITPKLHNEMVSDTEEMNGTGNNTPGPTDPGVTTTGNSPNDASPATVKMYPVSERSGHKQDVAPADGKADGRIYRYEYAATNDGGPGCASDPSNDADDLIVTVPHDCRGGACRPDPAS